MSLEVNYATAAYNFIQDFTNYLEETKVYKPGPFVDKYGTLIEILFENNYSNATNQEVIQGNKSRDYYKYITGTHYKFLLELVSTKLNSTNDIFHALYELTKQIHNGKLEFTDFVQKKRGRPQMFKNNKEKEIYFQSVCNNYLTLIHHMYSLKHPIYLRGDKKLLELYEFIDLISDRKPEEELFAFFDDLIMVYPNNKKGGKKSSTKKPAKKPTSKKKNRKIYEGPRGGKYYISNNRKVYL